MVSISERRFQSDPQNARFTFRGRPNWLITRHCFSLASFAIGITVFPLHVMDPWGQRFTWVLGATHAFCTQVHYPAHIWQVWVNIWESLVHLLDSSPGYGLCVYSIFSSYIVAGCSPEVTWTTIWNSGSSFHKIGVVQKIPHSYRNNPQKEKVIDRDWRSVCMAITSVWELFCLLLNFHLINLEWHWKIQDTTIELLDREREREREHCTFSFKSNNFFSLVKVSV